MAVNAEALVLHEAVDGVLDAWAELAEAAARRLEGWPDDPARLRAAQASVQTATRKAELLLAHALRDCERSGRGDDAA